MKLALRALRDSFFICRLMKPVSIHRILKMLPFMKSKEFVNCYFFEASDKIAVTHFQTGVWHLIILTSDVGFPLFPMKKHFPAYRVHSASNDYSDFLPSEAKLENYRRYGFYAT